MPSRHSTLTIIFFCLICVIVYLISRYNKQDLATNGIVTTATIKNVVKKKNSGGNFFAEYQYLVDGSLFKGSQAFECRNKSKDEAFSFLYGKTVLVVYSSKRPKNSRILLMPSDYEKIDIKLSFEDSLYVKEFCIVCGCR